MKKHLIYYIIITLVIYSCGSKTESTATEDYGTPTSESEPVKIDENLVAQGAALVKKSDCMTCHHVTNVLVGPAHTEVAKKYEFTNENIEMIADRIINGSSGVWGQVMMTPHRDISKDDALKMARYVLSLDGEKEPD